MRRQLILASSSPRRHELLTGMGLRFKVVVPDVEESGGGSPLELVRELALKKAQAVALLFPDDLVLAADTVVAVEGLVLGKPKDESDAGEMLRLLSGRWHQVLTGVCLADRGEYRTQTAVTEVCFAPLSDQDIAFYCASGEPMGKAGAYAIQGLGGMFVQEIRGSYSNVVGLPTALVRGMLQAAGYPIY